MRKRWMALMLVLCLALALLPGTAGAEDGEAAQNISQYLPEHILSKDDLTVGGIPFYELSIEEALALMPAGSETGKTSYYADWLDATLEDHYTLYRGKTTGRSTWYYSVRARKIAGESTLYSFAYHGWDPNANEFRKFESDIRGITIGDSMESVLQKLGVSVTGAAALVSLVKESHTNLDLSAGKTYGSSLENDYFINGKQVEAPIIKFVTGGVGLYLTFTKASILAHISMELAAVPDYELSPAERIEKVENADGAAELISDLMSGMTEEEKQDPDCIDLITLYAETAAAKASSQTVDGGDVLINAALLSGIESLTAEAVEAVEAALASGGVTTARELFRTAILTTDSTNVTIHIDPDVLTTDIDRVRVETPAYALTFKLLDLAPDLTQILEFSASEASANPAARAASGAVAVVLPDGGTTNSVTVSLPGGDEDPTYQTVVSADGTAAASKYNPATAKMDGKINQSGAYTVRTNEKDFSDISGKSREMQDAIRYLASKGIINGRTATAFEPDGSISRAEIATLLVKALGKLDAKAAATFSDVTDRDWFRSAAASSQRAGLIGGYEDNTFRGNDTINKVQTVVVSSRVLKSEMRYKSPADPSAYLAKYSDAVAEWARPEVALATRENLVAHRTDGAFSGESSMTRGDAAIIIYRLFQRIW